MRVDEQAPFMHIQHENKSSISDVRKSINGRRFSVRAHGPLACLPYECLTKEETARERKAYGTSRIFVVLYQDDAILIIYHCHGHSHLICVYKILVGKFQGE